MSLYIKYNENSEVNFLTMDSMTENMKKNQKIFNKYFLSSIFFFSFLLCLVQFAAAASVTLSWNRNQEPDIAGYRVYWGTSSRGYTDSVTINDTANQPVQKTYTVDGLAEGKTYYFAVKAVDLAGQVSSFSDEVISFSVNSFFNVSSSNSQSYF